MHLCWAGVCYTCSAVITPKFWNEPVLLRRFFLTCSWISDNIFSNCLLCVTLCDGMGDTMVMSKICATAVRLCAVRWINLRHLASVMLTCRPMFFCFMPSLKRSIHLRRDVPLGRDPSIWVFNTDFTTLSSSLRCTWPNHDSRFFMRKVLIGFMRVFSRMTTFLTWSFLVFPCIHLSIFISVVLITFSYRPTFPTSMFPTIRHCGSNCCFIDRVLQYKFWDFLVADDTWHFVPSIPSLKL